MTLKPEWWMVHSANMVWLINCLSSQIDDHVCTDERNVDELLRDLRAVVAAFERECRQRAEASAANPVPVPVQFRQ